MNVKLDGLKDEWMEHQNSGIQKYSARKKKTKKKLSASPNKNVNLFQLKYWELYKNWFNLLPEKTTSWTALRVQLPTFYCQILISASSFCQITNLYISKNDLEKQVETECSEHREFILRFGRMKPAWLYDRNCSQRLESTRVCPDVMFACSLNCDLQGIITHISTHMFCVNALLQRE